MYLGTRKQSIPEISGLRNNSAAIEVLWTGTLAMSFGNLSAGSKMRAHSAMFFEFKDGKIASQRNYDCFEPW